MNKQLIHQLKFFPKYIHASTRILKNRITIITYALIECRFLSYTYLLIFIFSCNTVGYTSILSSSSRVPGYFLAPNSALFI